MNGGITHPLLYSRFMLWLRYSQVLLSTPGMLHLFVSLPCCILRCTLGLLRKFCVLGLRWYCPAGSCGISVAHHKPLWDSSDVDLQLAKAGKLYRKQGSCAHLYQLKNWSIFLLSISVSLAGKTAEALIYHLFPWASKQKGRCCSPNNEV